MRLRFRSQRGFVLITVLMVLAVVGVIGSAMLDQTGSAIKLVANDLETDRAFYAANAGMEYAHAWVTKHNGSILDGYSHSETFDLGPYSSHYTVTFTPSGPSWYKVTSTGTSGSSTRVITSNVGNSTPGGSYKAVRSNWTAYISPNVQICGDVMTGTDIYVSSNVQFYRDGDNPLCHGTGATGTLIADGKITEQDQKVKAWGGMCSYNMPNPGLCPPDGQPPEMTPMAPFDFTHSATSLYNYPNVHRYSGNTTLPSGTYGSADGDVYWVDGNLTTGGAILLNGRVSFVASKYTGGSGNIIFNGDVTNGPNCNTTTNPCSALFASEGWIDPVSNSSRVIWGTMYTKDTTNGMGDGKNHLTIHGTVVAGSINMGNNGWIIDDNPVWLAPAPGAPGQPGPGVTFQNWTGN